MTMFQKNLKNHNVQNALETLKKLIRKQYPHVTFEVTEDFDDPEGIDLMAKVNGEDANEVLDLVLPTVFRFQDKGVPIHVIPL